MKRFLLIALASVGGLFLFGILFLLAMSWALLTPPPLPDRFVLEIEVDGELVETVADDPLVLALERGRTRTRDVVEALHRARTDDRVVGVLFRGGGGLPGWGTADELREAVIHFRSSGKPALYFTESFGELTPSQLSYHLATAFDEILIQPSGEVGIAHLSMDMPFLRGTLDRLEITPRFSRRAEYKDAAEIFMAEQFSAPAREAREALLHSVQETLTAGVMEGRRLSRSEVEAILSGGPLPAREALQAGLLDDLTYLDGARNRMTRATEPDVSFLSLGEYRSRGRGGWERGPRVALVYGVGTIHRGRSGYDPLSGSTSFGAASVAAHLREAVADPSVRAILFRVDSPGGSWVASDQVRRELQRARENGKPVVVSMGNLAASGGYVVSMDATRIVAHPTTFTGSIGVVGGRLVVEDFLNSVGITIDRIEGGPGSGYFPGAGDHDAEGWARLEAFLDRIYEDFVTGVAKGRDLPFDEVEALARGRVWTGHDALDRGLVDRLGGFTAALDEIRTLLEVAEDAPLNLVQYPGEKTLFQLLMEEGRSGSVRNLSGLRALFRGIGALGRVLDSSDPRVLAPVEAVLPAIPSR